jgi:hypothetical protein
MTLDFTLRIYEDLCCSIERVQQDCRFVHYVEDPSSSRIILRHDVDRRPMNALRMALLENRIGLRSTYYFRCVPSSFDASIICQIANMGHEVGYHYEVMSKAKGDASEAKRIFKDDLKDLRSLCEINTACMHGSPASKHINMDFWRDAQLSEFGLMGEAYLTIGNEVTYFTDTGGRWNSKFNIRDKISKCKMPSEMDTREIISRVPSDSTLYISCHPERWAGHRFEWMRYRMMDRMTNGIKVAFNVLNRKSVNENGTEPDRPL